MKMKYNVTGGGRKRMVAIISREARCQAVYTRMPECAYVIGTIKVTRDGELVWDERTDSGFMEMIVEALADEGFHPESREEVIQANEAAAQEEHGTADGSEASVESEVRSDDETTAEETPSALSDEQLPDTNGEASTEEETESESADTAEAGETETTVAEEEADTASAEETGSAETEAAAPEDVTEASAEDSDTENSDDRSGETGSPAEEEPSGKMEISMPKDSFTETAFSNLEKIIGSKRKLLMKALEADSLPVMVSDNKVTFPWFKDPEGDPIKASAYAHLVEGICRMAKEAKRVVATERETESEKYTFRCFLLRLGFVGPEYKHERAVLMENLSGHTAFKTQEEADAFYAKLKAKKEAQKKETAAAEESGAAAPEETNSEELDKAVQEETYGEES